MFAFRRVRLPQRPFLRAYASFPPETTPNPNLSQARPTPTGAFNSTVVVPRETSPNPALIPRPKKLSPAEKKVQYRAERKASKEAAKAAKASTTSESTIETTAAAAAAPRRKKLTRREIKNRRYWKLVKLRTLPKRPQRRRVSRRPRISLDAPKKWNRVLAEGVLPAYDEALKYIYRDSVEMRKEVERRREEVGRLEGLVGELEERVGKGGGEGEGGELELELKEASERLEEARKVLDVVEVQSEVNLPSVRWQVANAMGDLTRPSHRHLMEQRWRKEGTLDLLMERIYQMHVIPDILPTFNPTIDLRVSVRHPFKILLHKTKSSMMVEPGKYILPEQTLVPPALYADVFHTDTRLYTLLMVDYDVPDEQNATFTSYLHWLCPNIPLSTSTPRTRIPNLNTHTPYIPPHPQKGTPYHRYVLMLLQQPPVGVYSRNIAARAAGITPTSTTLTSAPTTSTTSALTTRTTSAITSKHIDVPVIGKGSKERVGFNVRRFCAEYGIDLTDPMRGGGGIYMWRGVWDSTVSNVYRFVLHKPEPVYGKPPKLDPYRVVKGEKKYLKH